MRNFSMLKLDLLHTNWKGSFSSSAIKAMSIISKHINIRKNRKQKCIKTEDKSLRSKKQKSGKKLRKKKTIS